MTYRIIKEKSNQEIRKEWDALAEVRFQQISTGIDITYQRFLVPTIMNMIPIHTSTALDVGCGIGYLSGEINKKQIKVTAIDPSAHNISVAKKNFSKDILYINSNVETFSKITSTKYDIIVANMVLMDTLNLDAFLSACRCLISENGRLLFSITHPFFWPAYFGYDKDPQFSYSNCCIVESPFKITNDNSVSYVSTHIHRPVSSYINAFYHNGFALSRFDETMPDSETLALYPTPWNGPRYIFGSCAPV